MGKDKPRPNGPQGGAKTTPAKPPITGKATGARPPAKSQLLAPMHGGGKGTRGTGKTSNKVPKGG